MPLELIPFVDIQESGIQLPDTFDSWRMKTNGLIQEVIDANDRHTELRELLYDGGGAEKFATLTTAQSISGVKTFAAGTALAPVLRVGSAGFWYSAGESILTSTHSLRASKLYASGSGLHLNGRDYLTPSALPTASQSFLVSGADGIWSWLSPSSLVHADGTIALEGNRFKVGSLGNLNFTDNSISGSRLADGTIFGGKIALSAISTGNIANGAITGAKIASGTITNANLSANSVTGTNVVDGTLSKTKIASGEGMPLQMIQTSSDTTQTFVGSDTAWTTITALTQAITIRNAAKVRIQATIHGSLRNGTVFNEPMIFRIIRDGVVAVGVPTTAGSRRAALSALVVDSSSKVGSTTIDFIDTAPRTGAGAVTYAIQAAGPANWDCYINRSTNDSNTNQYVRTISSITLTELS